MKSQQEKIKESNPSVTGAKPQRIQVRREYREVPWPGGSGGTRRKQRPKWAKTRGKGQASAGGA